MEQIRDDCGLEETPRPCKYFSLIGGTSTGGIIAIMLGRLGMTVKQCLEAYKRMAEQAFTPKGNVFSRTFSLPASPQGRFSGKHLADAVKKIVKEYTGDAEAVFADKTCVKTVVLAVTKADVGALPTKFKTYSIGDDFKHCKIWEVARATSAATTFFESISIGHQDIEFIDAGFGHNNPSEVLSSEAEDMFQDSTYDCMLSIGTGLGDVITIKDSRRSIIKALKSMASHSQAVHRRLSQRLSEAVYFRFDVTRGLDDVTLSDWKESSTISAHTRNYLAEVDVERQIKRYTDSISPHENTQRTSDHQAYNRREHRDARNGQDFNQTCLLVSAVLDFITLVQRDASTNALVDHMVQHHIPLQALQQVRSQQNIAQPVLLSNPVIVYTGFGQQVISFSLDEIGSLLEFQQFMSNAARGMLEDRFKAKGSAKFIKGEFLLQDENEHILSLRSPWKSIMKPGQRRNLSVKFRATATTACPHCQTENDFVEDEGTFCKNCEVTYQRIVELTPEDKESKDEMSQSTAVFRHKLHGPRREDVTDDQLKLCFHRITLTQDFSRLKDMAYEFPCKAGGCNTIFRGVYARTNLARHMGRKHNGPRVYFCEDKWCYRVFNRVFRRQDAQLEHYRKYHLGVPRPTISTIILNLLCGHKLDFKKATREAKEVVDKAQEPYNTYKEAQRIEEGKLQIQLEQLKNNMEAAAVTTAEAALKVAKNNNTAFRAAQAGLDPLDKINDAVYTTLDAAVQAAGTICDIRVARLTGTLIANKQEQKPFEIYLEGTLLKDELKLNLDLTPGETGKFLKDVSSEALALITPGKKKTV
ncbi:hypothetical protein AA0117_g11787 [Alternaria alternata]|uniref:PNPLA domain-containing protein n=1 Tax=Alternaria alternata TaxID=5599 RepID=A0A4Q4N274_ALTAL|nr:hypothetical protein AA0117_g11787 [Alternaria alternata]